MRGLIKGLFGHAVKRRGDHLCGSSKQEVLWLPLLSKLCTLCLTLSPPDIMITCTSTIVHAIKETELGHLCIALYRAEKRIEPAMASMDNHSLQCSCGHVLPLWWIR
jgi:hypothetical protein